MKKALVVLAIIAAALGLGLVAGGASPGCCLIPQASAAATAMAKVTTLHIEGMSCGACATAVKRVLKGVDGVKDAQVSFKEKKGVVTYDPAKVTPEKIAHAVAEKLPTYKATVAK